MPTTVTIADDLALQLRPYENQLAEIFELGIREWNARSETGYHGIGHVLEKLAALPDPEEVLTLRPTPGLQERIDALLQKNRDSTLTETEQREWAGYQFVEHLVRLAKLSAIQKLRVCGT